MSIPRRRAPGPRERGPAGSRPSLEFHVGLDGTTLQSIGELGAAALVLDRAVRIDVDDERRRDGVRTDVVRGVVVRNSAQSGVIRQSGVAPVVMPDDGERI